MKNEGLVVLERALCILRFVAERADASLAEISEGTGFGKSTALRLLSSLETAGLLGRQPDTQRYYVGARVFEYSRAASQGSSLIRVAHPHMVSLESEFGEAVGLHVRVGNRRFCVDEVEARNPLRYVHEVGSEGPLSAGAIGKVLLAFLPLGELEDLLSQLEFRPLAGLAPRTRAELEDELEVTRRRGYGVSRGEIVPGTVSVASPVFGREGRVVAALSLTGVAERLPERRLAVAVDRLCEAAGLVSRAFGYRGPNMLVEREEEEVACPQAADA